jgi:hypothetical protein
MLERTEEFGELLLDIQVNVNGSVETARTAGAHTVLLNSSDGLVLCDDKDKEQSD